MRRVIFAISGAIRLAETTNFSKSALGKDVLEDAA
jgi:hypothetical protein